MTDSQNNNLVEHIKQGQGTIETQYKSNIDTGLALISYSFLSEISTLPERQND